MLNLHTIGGYSEVGKNMTAIELDEDAFVLDQGFFLPAIVAMQERDRDEYSHTEKKLRQIQAIPDDLVIDKFRHKVRAQLIGHAHLDHVGAVPFISDRYNAPIYGTPFTMAVLDSLLKDNDSFLRNKVKSVQPNSSLQIKGKNKSYRVEFINITHSTPQTAMIVVHTPKGAVVYANDFKLDDNPILGLKPNYERLRQIAKEGVHALVVDSLYSGTDRKTPSEKIARHLLEEVLFTIDNKHSGIVVTTFSSHIARLKSIVEFGKKLNREVVFVGRSLNKYSSAAKSVGIAPFLNSAKISTYRRQVEKTLQKVNKNRKNYLLVCTGHQGEPGSVLERISRNNMAFKVNKDDNIVFSSSVIPSEINKENFSKMEEKLRKRKARLFRDVHVSGHAGREDLRDILRILNPRNVIPSHGGIDKTGPMADLCREMGFGKNQIHLMKNRQVLKL